MGGEYIQRLDNEPTHIVANGFKEEAVAPAGCAGEVLHPLALDEWWRGGVGSPSEDQPHPEKKTRGEPTVRATESDGAVQIGAKSEASSLSGDCKNGCVSVYKYFSHASTPGGQSGKSLPRDIKLKFSNLVEGQILPSSTSSDHPLNAVSIQEFQWKDASLIDMLVQYLMLSAQSVRRFHDYNLHWSSFGESLNE
jgi:hypothetical protein